MDAHFWAGVAVGLVFGSIFMAVMLGAVIDKHHKEN